MNAVYSNKIEAIDDASERAAYVAASGREYEEDVDLMRLASELVIDGIVSPEELRGELGRRFAALDGKQRVIPEKHHGVPPASVDHASSRVVGLARFSAAHIGHLGAKAANPVRLTILGGPPFTRRMS